MIKQKLNKKSLPKLPESFTNLEDRYDRITRESKEKREKQADDKLQEKKNIATEQKRMQKLIVPYLDKLQDQLVKKDLMAFAVYHDEPGFIKHPYIDIDTLQKIINKDVSKYANRTITNLSMHFYHNDKPDEMHRSAGYYFIVDINIFNIDKKGILNGDKKSRGADIAWEDADFKLSKFSFKLLYVLLNAIVSQRYDYSSLTGIPLTYVVNDLQKIGVDFVNTLTPLPGAN